MPEELCVYSVVLDDGTTKKTIQFVNLSVELDGEGNLVVREVDPEERTSVLVAWFQKGMFKQVLLTRCWTEDV